ESKFTQSGTSVATFSIATSWRQKDQQTGEWKEHTDWHNIVFWRAENVAPYLVKGTQVFIEGRLQTRNYENKEGKKVYVTEVVADNLILLGGRQGGEGGGGGGDMPVSMPRSVPRSSAPQQAQHDDSSFDQGITDDDVPF